ncbi:GtrA family protein [Roseibium sp. HPY-6]|uniref:GtrA family protein n=1 Tax=Roseibium sp. HPY-6 TaxID=3229852 RepID=UPI00338ECDB0
MQTNAITDNSLFRFLLVGVLSNILNFSVYTLFIGLFASVLMAAGVGYSAGLLSSFLLGKAWVFKSSQPIDARTVFFFLTVYLIGGAGMSLIANLASELLQTGPSLSWLAGALFAVANNYLGSRLLVFAEEKNVKIWIPVKTEHSPGRGVVLSCTNQSGDCSQRRKISGDQEGHVPELHRSGRR